MLHRTLVFAAAGLYILYTAEAWIEAANDLPSVEFNMEPIEKVISEYNEILKKERMVDRPKHRAQRGLIEVGKPPNAGSKGNVEEQSALNLGGKHPDITSPVNKRQDANLGIKQSPFNKGKPPHLADTSPMHTPSPVFIDHPKVRTGISVRQEGGKAPQQEKTGSDVTIKEGDTEASQKPWFVRAFLEAIEKFTAPNDELGDHAELDQEENMLELEQAPVETTRPSPEKPSQPIKRGLFNHPIEENTTEHSKPIDDKHRDWQQPIITNNDPKAPSTKGLYSAENEEPITLFEEEIQENSDNVAEENSHGLNGAGRFLDVKTAKHHSHNFEDGEPAANFFGGRTTQGHSRGFESREPQGNSFGDKATQGHSRGFESREPQGNSFGGQAIQGHSRGFESREPQGNSLGDKATQGHSRGAASRGLVGKKAGHSTKHKAKNSATVPHLSDVAQEEKIYLDPSLKSHQNHDGGGKHKSSAQTRSTEEKSVAYRDPHPAPKIVTKDLP